MLAAAGRTKSSIMAGDQGVVCVMYYGMPVKDAKGAGAVESPILGIFAKQDEWITPEVAANLRSLAKATGKTLKRIFMTPITPLPN